MPAAGSYDLTRETGGVGGQSVDQKHMTNGTVSSTYLNGSPPVPAECNGGPMGVDSTHTGVSEKPKTEIDTRVSVSSSTSSLDKDPSKIHLFRKKMKKLHIGEKVNHLITVASLMALSMSVVKWPWFLPYYYTVSLPLLIIYRLSIYIKYKWQYFMLDFCYFANTLAIIYIWAAPGSPQYFMVIFAVTNGPLMWATVIYRNSMVFYSSDKMISLYIHIIPSLLAYVIRWYPKETSRYWYTPFAAVEERDVGNLFLYLVVLSLAAYIFHTVLYITLIFGIFRPGKEYLFSYNYLLASESGWIHWLASRLGKKGQFVVYFLINWLICLASSLLGILWYKYLLAHSIFVIFILLFMVWNGGTYYIDVLATKGLRSATEDEQIEPPAS